MKAVILIVIGLACVWLVRSIVNKKRRANGLVKELKGLNHTGE